MSFDDAYDFSVEYYIQHLEEVPEMYFSFPLKFQFTMEDMWMFKNKKRKTGLGSNWFLDGETLYIHRGSRIQYKIKLDMDTWKHRVKYYLYEPSEMRYWKNFLPEEELLIGLEKWTRHTAIIGEETIKVDE